MSLVAPTVHHQATVEPHGSASDLVVQAGEVSISSATVELSRYDLNRLRDCSLMNAKPRPCQQQDSVAVAPLALQPAPSATKKRPTLAKKLSTRFGFAKHHTMHNGDEENVDGSIGTPFTPVRSPLGLPNPTLPKAPMKKPSIRFHAFQKAIPFSLSPKSIEKAPSPSNGLLTPPSSPPSYREVELQRTWAAIGVDIYDSKMDPKPHCTPQELTDVMDDFFGGGGRGRGTASPCSKKQKKVEHEQHQGETEERRRVDAIRQQGLVD